MGTDPFLTGQAFGSKASAAVRETDASATRCVAEMAIREATACAAQLCMQLRLKS